MTLPTILTESAREFDELVGDVPDDALLQVYGREVCAMCGHPTKADSVVKNIKSFLLSKQRAVIEAVIAEAEGMMKSQCVCHIGGGSYVHCGECKDTKTCAHNTALSDLISRLREALNEKEV